jgi:hypothetical protein
VCSLGVADENLLGFKELAAQVAVVLAVTGVRNKVHFYIGWLLKGLVAIVNEAHIMLVHVMGHFIEFKYKSVPITWNILEGSLLLGHVPLVKWSNVGWFCSCILR